jgi:TRAP-type C4-dicarboxylate transport system permease small subunit
METRTVKMNINTIFNKWYSVFDHINRILVILAGTMIVVMTVLININVITRYFLKISLLHALAINEILMVFITFLVAAWLLKNDWHIRMDFILDKFKPEYQCVIDILLNILSMFISAMLVWFGTLAVFSLSQKGITLEGTLKIPRGPLIAVIPFGFLMLFIEFPRKIYEIVMRLKKIRMS